MARKKNRKRGSETTTTHENALRDPEVLHEALELQKQEMEVLQAIYDTDLTLSTSTLVYTHVFTIRLSCESFGASSLSAEVILHFDLGKAYPLKQPPVIQVELKHGLSDDEVRSLTQSLEQLAEEKVGEVMIYDLVMRANEFIQDHLKDQSSFFDQMVQRQNQLQTEQKLHEEIENEREEQEKMAEKQQLQALIDEEMKKKNERMRSRILTAKTPYASDGEEESEVSGSSSSESEFSSDDVESLESDHPQSRYHSDFKELGLLGRGGGGEVAKARNRLDRQLYAVKKVKLDPEDPTMKKKILREVKTISRMQHRHIVRYYQAWIEGEDGDSSSDSDDDEEEAFWQRQSTPRDYVGTVEETGNRSSDVQGDELNESFPETEDEDDWLGSMGGGMGGMWSTSKHSSRHANHFPSRAFHRSTSQDLDDGFDWESLEDAGDGDDDAAEDKDHRKDLDGNREKRRSEKLYIQMEFCEGKALREVIDQGNLHSDPDKIWTLFRQILEAIEYIHHQGIIHRDIKPANIFLDAEGTVKLGDFGLAIRPQKLSDEAEEENGEHVVDDILAESSASSAAELYGRLKVESIEKTRMMEHHILSAAHAHLATSTSYISDAMDTITAGVGTAFYRAPEQEKEGQRYNQKADMFSLGILFFEMWHPPFTTLMERAKALICLRETDSLPESFIAPDNVKQIILKLCDGSPSKRPNAKELLTSQLLPPKMQVEESYLKEALETLSNPQGKFYSQLIDTLILQEPVSHVDYTYDHLESIKMRSYILESRARTFIKHILQRVFERHGALEHVTPLLMPRPLEQNYTGIALRTPPTCCSLVDSSGVSVTLPFDLTERTARFVARHNIARMKCYQFDRVYRKSFVGGHPRELLECDFDIIWEDRAGSARCVELETLQVVAEVSDSLASSLGPYYLRLNDARVTKCIMDLCGVPSTCRREICRLLSTEISSHVHAGSSSASAPNLKPGRWKFITKKIRELGVPEGAVEMLKPFFLLPENCETSLGIIEVETQKILAIAIAAVRQGDEKNAKLAHRRELFLRRCFKDFNEGLSTLRLIVEGMKFLQMTGPMCTRVDVGLHPRLDRYSSGFIFQADLFEGTTSSSSVVKGARVIAEGGRYDSLIARFRLPAAHSKAPSVAAMGVRFSVDRMVSSVLASTAFGSTGNICDQSKVEDFGGSTGANNILVCSAGKSQDNVLLRMQVALMLWKKNISTDFLHPDNLHLEDLEELCAQQNLAYMVIVQKHLLKDKKQVKVRYVKNPAEPDVVVGCSSLAEFFAKSLKGPAGRKWNDNSTSNRPPHRNSQTAANMSLPAFDVKVLDSKFISKDRNKGQMDFQRITRRVSKWITSSFASKGDDAMQVLSVDLPFVAMRELATSLMEKGHAGVDQTCANHPRYKKLLKNTAEELLDFEPSAERVGGERYVLLHSLVDDRYDLISLHQSAKSAGSSNRRNL